MKTLKNRKSIRVGLAVALFICICFFSKNMSAQWVSMPNSGFSFIKIVFAKDSMAIVQTYTNAIYKTIDLGQNWNSFQIGPTATKYDTYFLNDTFGYSVSRDGYIYNSLDGGDTWVLHDSIDGVDTLIAAGYYMHDVYYPTKDSGFVTFTDTYPEKTYVLSTLDGGKNWNSSSILPNDAMQIYFINSLIGFLVTDNYVYRTADGGQNWNSVIGGTSYYFGAYGNSRYIQFVNATDGYLVDGNKHLYQSKDAGLTWNLVYTSTTSIEELFFVDEKIGFIGGHHDGTILKTIDGGASWTSHQFPTDSIFGFYFINKNIGYAIGGSTNLFVTTNGGGIDSSYVWPGDANADKVVDMFDFLYLGIAYGDSGYARPNASLTWIEQPVKSWGKVFQNANDYSHADCNGNEDIDINDTTAILSNYGLTHNKMGNTSKAMATTIPFYLEFPKDTLLAGDTVKIPIYLGSSTTNANDIYGLAFSITYDTKLMKAGSAKVSFTNSWLGTIGSDMHSLVKDSFNQVERVDVGLTRIVHNNTSGYGEIGELEIVLSDNISGLPLTERTLHLTIENEKVISFDETEWGVVIMSDSAYVTDSLTYVNNQAGFILPKVLMYPNPAKETLYIVSNEVEIYSVKVFNSLGEMLFVSEENNTSSLNISCKNFEAGIYLLQIETNAGILIKKFAKQ